MQLLVFLFKTGTEPLPTIRHATVKGTKKD